MESKEVKKITFALIFFPSLVQARGASVGEGSILLGVIALFALLYLFLKLGKGTSLSDSEAIFKGSAIFLMGIVALAFLIKLIK